jgi:hypothetical protein
METVGSSGMFRIGEEDKPTASYFRIEDGGTRFPRNVG